MAKVNIPKVKLNDGHEMPALGYGTWLGLDDNEEGIDEKIDYLESWRGFEKVLELGLARSVGVSNFNLGQMKRLIANCKVKPVANQIEVTLNLGQTELVKYCQGQGVVIIAYSPFGTLVPSHAFDGSPEPKINNPDMVAIAKKHGKSVTQVCLRYLYQRGIVSIPKTATKARVLDNATIFDFELDPTDVATIKKFDINFRRVTNEFWQPYTYYPFEKQFEHPPPIPKSLLVWKNGVDGDIE